jgi:ABC-type amino acid transport substrate-binding protein
MGTRVLSLVLLLVLAGRAGATDLVLGTTILPPYQTERNGELEGRSVDTLDCVFDQLDASWRGRVMPSPRARLRLEEGELHGFFSAMPDPELERHAARSAPLALEKWYWFARNSELFRREDFPKGLRLGALQDSTTLSWLRREGMRPDTVVASPEQLLKLLETDRIDTYIADIRVARTAAAQLAVSPEQYSTHFDRYMPLVAYFSQGYLSEHSGFLERFNDQLNHCMDTTFRLEPAERSRLARMAEHSMRPWTQSPLMIKTLRRINRERGSFDADHIRALDAQWRAHSDSGEHELIQAVAETKLSRFLRQQQREADGLVREIMVTGRHGLNAAMSRVTTDYWQGDETKFRKTFNQPDKAPVIEQIRYDRSTRRFLAHVSLPVRDPDSDKLLGVLTAGVDIQKALTTATP